MGLYIFSIKWGKKYSADYVNRLYNMIKRNLNLPFKFICLTEDSNGLNPEIEALPFTRPDLEFCWTKLNIFETNLYGLSGTCFFLDLDIVITGNLDSLFNYQPEKDFIGVLDWVRKDQINSSVMRFEIGKFNFILDNFDKMIEKKQLIKTREWDVYLKSNDKIVYWEGDNRYGGDQEWISKQLNQKELKDYFYNDEWILSYKEHGRGKVPANCKILVFHGDPKPHEVDEAYVANLWK